MSNGIGDLIGRAAREASLRNKLKIVRLPTGDMGQQGHDLEASERDAAEITAKRELERAGKCNQE